MASRQATLEYLTTTKIGEKGQLTVPKQFRRVSTTLRQVLTKFSEFFVCWIRVPSFPREISLQDRLATTIGDSVDPQHSRFCRFLGAFRFSKVARCCFICIVPVR